VLKKLERSGRKSESQQDREQTAKYKQLEDDIVQLKLDIAQLKLDNEKLKLLVQESKEQSEATLTEGHSFFPPDPYGDWIRQHLDLLKKEYPSHFVAIDLEKGIILAEKEGEDFSRKYQELIEREGVAGDRYLQMHTSSYVDGTE